MNLKSIIYNIYKILIILILIIIYYLYFYFINIKNITSFLSSIETHIQFKKIDKYLKLCSNNKSIIQFNQFISPKISVITPVYNREKYIIKFFNSINNQLFYRLEILLIDDCSIDNSRKIIENLQNKDKRLILIKNKKNKGTLISRNIGVLYSKGKYLIMPDPDDIIDKNILKICYIYAEKYNYEMIRFNMYNGKDKQFLSEIVNYIEGREVYQPELSTYLYYGNNKLEIIDCYITNKFIKKDLYIKVINYINVFYLSLYMVFMEDSIMNYKLYTINIFHK